MSSTKLNGLIVIIILTFLLMLTIMVCELYDNYYMGLEINPSRTINYTTNIKIISDGCYYQGRQYGCNRNLSELLK